MSRPLKIAEGYYGVWSGDLQSLDRVRRRLYAPEPLTPDERRDLANTLDGLLDRMTREPLQPWRNPHV